jgi:ectoine hydroxylase-related dioxygenase (phytanoyl-CoA dioxygenase family)
MQASNDLLGDPQSLRDRLAEDGYLYLQQVIDPQKVLRLRALITQELADIGWIEGGPFTIQAVAKVRGIREDEEAFFEGYHAVQRLEEFHALAHDEQLMAVMRAVVGASAFPHPLKVARIAFPAHHEVSTPPHQDYPNNQGTPNLTAAWIPVGDCPTELGGLAILRGSHTHGVLDLSSHTGAGNRQAVLPEELIREHRWVTTDYAAGDVLLFNSHTVHAALHNASEFNLRISVDYRYQCEREPLTELVLHPHFGRISWEEIYEGWASDELAYYWRDLDYEVVPFEDFDLVDRPDGERSWDSEAATLGEAIVEGVQSGSLEFSPEEWREIMRGEAMRDARHRRLEERKAEVLGITPENSPPASG